MKPKRHAFVITPSGTTPGAFFCHETTRGKEVEVTTYALTDKWLRDILSGRGKIGDKQVDFISLTIVVKEK